MRKIWRTPSSDSPSHLVKISGPSTEMKFTPHSLASALASSVLPVPGGPYEQDADMRRQAARGQDLRIAQRQFDRLLQPAFDRVEPADVAPRYVRHADQGFAQRRGPGLRQRQLEVFALDPQILERDAEGGAMVLQIAGAAAQPREPGVAAQLHQVGAEEAVGALGDLVEIGLGVVRQRHLAGVNFQDFAPAGDVGRADENLAVEAAGPAERRIDGVDAIGGADHDHRSRRA